jgi:gliding motility-associated-like protein
MDKPFIFHILLLLSSLSSLYFQDKVYIEPNSYEHATESASKATVQIEAAASGSLPNLTVWCCHPGPSSNYTICNSNQVGVECPPGSLDLSLSNTQNNGFEPANLTVGCTGTESIDLTLLLNNTDTICLSTGALSGPIISVTNVCENGTYVEYEILEDSCVILTGINEGGETACFIACDANGFCDTTIINSTVVNPFPNGISDTIIISTSSSYCFEPNQLNIVGDIFTMENICLDQTDTSVAFTIDPINNCILYEGLLAGTDTACVSFCDEFNNCDTVQVLITAVPGFTVLDTVFITVDTNTFCLSDSLLPGDIVLVEDICPEDNGEQVIFEINGLCVDYYGIGVGSDTACIKMVDEFGNVALYNLIVTVVRTTPETICDQIYIRETKEFCLDTLELPGIYTGFNIIYDNPNPNNVTFDPNPVNLCVRYEGLELGRDSFGIAVCDHFGFCDTTTFCITVNPYFDPPSLVDDSTATLLETPVLIDPLANDSVFGGLRDFYILTQPISGSAVLNLDGSVTYIPGPSFCARWDQFDYVVCNPNGCDTATINIFIECIELTIFTAVSPNNDDVNDYFYIAKIENFPNNRLWIYNRWGSLVFDTGKEGYKNNWPGSWGDDIDLPDGTYYYILEWSDNEVSTVQRGFFELIR